MLPTRLRPIVQGLFLAALLVHAPALARALDAPPLRPFQPPLFSADLAVTVDSSAHSTVTVTVTVPYPEMSWNRLRNGYAAGAGISVELEPENRARLFGASWEQRLLVEGYATTRNVRNSLIQARTFDVPPGRYRVRVRVRDLSSDVESGANDVLVVEDLSKVPVGFGDLELGVLDSAAVFTVIPTRRFGFNAGQLAARVTMFDRRAGAWPRQASFRVRMLDDAGAEVGKADTTLAIGRSAQPVILRAGSGDVFLGNYVLQIDRVEGKSRWRTSRSFEVEESGPPRGKAFEQMLEALSYVADAQEIDTMRHLSADEQAAAWERFWRRRDPTPDTPANEFQIEFFRRLRYSDQHFQGFGPGWRSDQGRIYVRYGPPDQIEQVAPTSSTPQREIWFYNQPYHRFIFEDREGFGRYTLLNPLNE